jgi:hypothetical protein
MGRQRKKSKSNTQRHSGSASDMPTENGGHKSVSFDAASNPTEYLRPSGSGMRPSPSMRTLNRMERDTYVLWKRPVWTILYAIVELFCLIGDFFRSLTKHKTTVFLTLSSSLGFYYLYLMPGPHQEYIRLIEKHMFWCIYWIGLGVLSSVGFGTGLHTFLIYLGPHIARVTLAAYECNSLDFPEPPYPDE